MTQKEQNIINRIEEIILTEGVSNDFLVSMLKLCEQYLQLERVSKTAERENKTTQGIRKFRTIVKICDYQFTINNE